MLALVPSMGPPGTIPAPSQINVPYAPACSQLKSSNVPYAPRAVNQRSQTCRTLCVRSMCVSSPRPTYDRSTCVSSPRLTYDRSTCVSSTRLTCASEECVSSQGLTYWLPQAATSDAMRIESCVCAPQRGPRRCMSVQDVPPPTTRWRGKGFAGQRCVYCARTRLERGPAGQDPCIRPQSHQSRKLRRDFSLRTTRTCSPWCRAWARRA